jgi:hypothetical protein
MPLKDVLSFSINVDKKQRFFPKDMLLQGLGLVIFG